MHTKMPVRVFGKKKNDITGSVLSSYYVKNLNKKGCQFDGQMIVSQSMNIQLDVEGGKCGYEREITKLQECYGDRKSVSR